MLSEQRISRATLWMSGGAVIRAGLALVAQMEIARLFGAGRDTDAYYIGLSVPQIIGDFLIGGVLFSAFIPVFVQTWKRDGEEQAWRMTSSLISIILIVLSICSLLYAVLAGPILRWMAPGFDSEMHRVAVQMARVLTPLFLLFGFSFLGAGILQSYRHFTTPALAPIAFPIAVILSCWLLADRLGIVSVAVGALVGAGVQCGILWAVLWRNHRGIRLGWDWRHPGLRRVARIMGPLAVGVIAINMNMIYQRFIASAAEEGMVAALAFGTTFASLPLLLILPLSRAIFPSLSAHDAEGKGDLFRDLLTRSLRWAGFVGIPIVGLLIVFREPFVRLLLQRGAFDCRDVAMVSQTLAILAVGTLFFSCNQLIARSFYARGTSWVPMWLNIAAAGITLPLNNLLLGPLGIGGLALARTCMFVIFFVGCLGLTSRFVTSLPWSDLALAWGKMIVLGLGMAFVADLTYLHSEKIGLSSGGWGDAVRMIFGSLLGGALFLGGAHLLKLREVREIWSARPWARA
ncbi:MAG: murein biosynthesis integral membrane protein MurJ [Planctomycetota bacterium]|nr:murein biosynthesis integral membrane protein MurJ [Planctomycetota bacterium]